MLLSVSKRIFALIARGFRPLPQIRYKELFFSALLLSHRADAAVIIQRPLYIGLTSGLVGYWSFDGQDTFGKVNKTIDGSGNNNHGTLTNGATTTIGKLGQALSFDGVDDYVAITENAGLAMSQGTLGVVAK